MLGQAGVTQCLLISAPAFDKDVLSPLPVFNYIIDWILVQALQDYPGVQVGATAHVSDLTYADDIVILSGSYSEMQGLLDAVNRHDATESMRTNSSKTKVYGVEVKFVKPKLLT